MSPLMLQPIHTDLRARLVLLLLLTCSIPGPIVARLTYAWTYQEMFERADLVVIAGVVSSKDTEERRTLLDDIRVIGVTTEFKSYLVLKGDKNVATFRLHHYRLQSEADENIVNGPDLVRIPKHPATFLLFLSKEPDGRYAPVTGQTDPAGLSVLELRGWAE